LDNYYSQNKARKEGKCGVVEKLTEDDHQSRCFAKKSGFETLMKTYDVIGK
jgi:hypothetical protein